MFFDIHTHLIPGVDDGSADLDMSETLLRQAIEQGTGALFVTPHSEAFLSQPVKTWESYYALKKMVERRVCVQGVPMRPFPVELYLGSEVYCERKIMRKVVIALASGQIPSMNGTKYVLTEFSPHVEKYEAMDCIRILQTFGWIPILAHPERYENLRDADFIRTLQDMGCWIQVNVYSLEQEGAARELVLSGLVDFLGSDAHSLFFRPPSIHRGLQWLQENVSGEVYRTLIWKNPQKFLKAP